ARAAAYDSVPQVRRAAARAVAELREATRGSWLFAPAPRLAPLPQEPYVAVVTVWYQHHLGRDPEPAGLARWVSRLKQGENHDDVLAGLLASQEYFDRHGSSSQGFVRGLYREILYREPTAAEVNSWVRRLLDLGADREQLARDFLNAAQL